MHYTADTCQRSAARQCAALWKMGFFEAIIFICLSAACAAQDADGALPVPTVHLTSQWSEIYPSEQAKLKCGIDTSDSWAVTWYKNDIELEKAESQLSFSGDGSELTLTAASQGQSGKYSCKGVHKITSNITQDSNSVQLTIHANKLNPILNHNVISQKIYVGESVSFTCSIDESSSWEYVFYLRDNPIDQSSRNVFTIPTAKDTHTGAYYCIVKRGTATVSSKSNTVSLEVLDVPVPTMKLQSSSPDVIVNEVVMLACESVGPDWSFTWFRNGEQLYQSSVFNIIDQGAQLHISSVSKDHQGLYTCKAHHKTKPLSSGQSQPLKITIHDTPKPTLSKSPVYNTMYVSEIVSFSCEVNILTGWTYKWYKDDKEISHTGSTINMTLGLADGGHYSCKATRGKGTTTASSDQINQVVQGVPVPSVKLLSQWDSVFPNEMVTLGCESGSTEWRFTWFKDETPVSADGSFKITEQGVNLQIISASKTAGYSCKAHHKTRPVSSEKSQPIHIRVFENTPKPTMTQDPVYNPMYMGETVNFTCRVDVASGWKFQWLLDDREIADNNSTISINVTSAKGGSYSCKATRGDRTTTGSSDKINLKVLEIPVPVVTHLTEWLDVFPSETVQLDCVIASGPSDWNYQWNKDGEEISWGANKILTITSASVSHKGQYKCKGILKSRHLKSSFSSGLNLTVYDHKPRPVLIQEPDYSILFPGEPLSFQCHINISTGWEFVWYSDSTRLNGNQKQYSVSTPGTTHSGSYTCTAKRGKTHSFITELSQVKKVEIRKDMPVPVMTQVPNVEMVYMGEMLNFRCALSISSDWEYHWFKDGQKLPIISNGYSIINGTHSDSGEYKCKAKRKKTMLKTDSQSKHIKISDIPVPSVKQLTQWLDVFPTETVKLGCGMATGASDWTYEWHKGGQPIPIDKNVVLDKDGTTLIIHSSVSHIGDYSCMGKHKTRHVQSKDSTGMGLKVYGAKPSVVLEQNPEYDVFYTEDSVYFSCGVSVSSGWEYLWYKNNHQVASGQNHTIGHLITSHTGEYTCQTKRGKYSVFHSDHSRAVKLEVKERPSVVIILLTGWSEVFSTDSLMLKCALKDEDTWSNWQFKWFKGDEEIAEPFSEKHRITPENDPDQSQYMCQGVRNGTLSYTRRSESFKTNNLLLKRRVLLSISGCLVFGICAVFFGCIILRIFRKPAAEPEKHEETNLFLTMAELKERGDAPCPLVEYITDEDMKELSKDAREEVENGTICSESTPLPITSEEDEAAASESNNATGNGEMVSFKQ